MAEKSKMDITGLNGQPEAHRNNSKSFKSDQKIHKIEIFWVFHSQNIANILKTNDMIEKRATVVDPYGS